MVTGFPAVNVISLSGKSQSGTVGNTIKCSVRYHMQADLNPIKFSIHSS
jgi:hypothetical protein